MMQLHSLIGFSVGALLGLLLPSLLSLNLFKTKRRRPLIKTAINSLERLNDEIFACFLQPSYPDNRYLFERRIHLEKNKFMLSVIELEQLNLTSFQQDSLQKLNQLYDLILSYSQLRWRVVDHTIFLLCTDELTDLATCISQVFSKASKHYSRIDKSITFDINGLPDCINRLEDN